MKLRTTMAAVAVTVMVFGLTAANETPAPTQDEAKPAATDNSARPAQPVRCDHTLECGSERECYDRIAACIARGGEWRGDETGGSCHPPE